MMSEQNKYLPLMPKATAVWLIENTKLTFKQIAEFCGMHELEVKSIADGEHDKGIIGISPIINNHLSLAEINRCEQDPEAVIQITLSTQKVPKKKTKYTPIARRQDKPDAIAWILKNYPDLQEHYIVKLIGTTKATIQAIKNRIHWNINNIRPRDPVLFGLCSQTELDNTIALSKEHKRDRTSSPT